jgi:hypothetical protein
MRSSTPASSCTRRGRTAATPRRPPGPARLIPEIEQTMGAFGDIAITVDVGPIVDGDLVSARWTMRATYAGGLPGATAPVGTEIAFSGQDILRVSGGKFVEYWTCTDVMDGLNQLGAIAGPNGPAPRPGTAA